MPANDALRLAIFYSRKRQIAIAKKAGIHESRFSKIVNGWIDPNVEERAAIARALKTTPEALFAMPAREVGAHG